MRPTTKYKQLLRYLEFRGSRTFSELMGKHTIVGTGITKNDGQEHYLEEFCFPRQTLDRLLKKGLVEGLIEKIEPKEKGERGRPAYQYRLVSAFTWTLPAIRFKDAYFFGSEKKRKNKKTFVLHSEDKQLLDALCLKNPVLAKAVKKDRNYRKRGLY